MNKEFVCGKAFEDLTNDEMMEVEGGIASSLSPIINVTTLPCGIGASISCIEWGAILTSIIVPDSKGEMADVALCARF